MPEADLYRHRGTRAIQRMVEYAPSTGGLALWVRHVDLPQEATAATPRAGSAAIAVAASVPTIATDGNAVYYAPTFEQLTLSEQTGLVAHEVLHIALRHPQRLVELRHLIEDVDLKLFNICADAIVNSTLSHLTWLTLPALSVLLDKLVAVALSEKQTHRRLAPNRRARTSAKTARAARVRMMGGETGPDLMPGTAAGAPESAAEQARLWSERLLRGHAGDGAHSLLRTLLAHVPRTRTPWEQVLRAQLAYSLAPKPGLSWSRPSRSYMANQGRAGTHRLPWTPGFSSLRPSPQLGVIVDVLGSIEDTLLEKFAREIEAITRRQEAGLVLVVGDDQVRRVAEFAPGRSDLRNIEFSGGGSTNFTPLLQEADKYRPDIVVVLTDLDGPAHFRPRWRGIWAVAETHAAAIQPFGRKLILS